MQAISGSIDRILARAPLTESPSTKKRSMPQCKVHIEASRLKIQALEKKIKECEAAKPDLTTTPAKTSNSTVDEYPKSCASEIRTKKPSRCERTGAPVKDRRDTRKRAI
jgi:hypothetical protein